jgi:hypothetical protein
MDKWVPAPAASSIIIMPSIWEPESTKFVSLGGLPLELVPLELLVDVPKLSGVPDEEVVSS